MGGGEWSAHPVIGLAVGLAAGLSSLVAVAATATAAGPPPIEVRGDSACPTASEVSAALVGLLAAPKQPMAGAPDVVELIAQGPSVGIRLSNATRQVIAEKRLPDSMSCAERARAAAVIVAAWEVHLRAGASPMWSPPPAVPAPTAPPAAVVQTTAPPPPRPPDPFRVETGAAVLASIAAGEIAPGALLEVGFGRRDSGFALGLGALAVGAHSTTVATGRGTWRRFGGIIDLESSSSWQTVQLQLRAGLALTAVPITGESFPITTGTTILDPGALTGLRLRYRGARLSPWLEAATALWPRRHVLTVSGATTSAELPPFEVFVAVGLSFNQGH